MGSTVAEKNSLASISLKNLKNIEKNHLAT